MATLFHLFERGLGLLLLGLIRLYQVTLSPLLGNVCRFHPSCSRYTAACIERFGPFKGGYLGARTAVARGSGFVRTVFVVLLLVFIVKIGYDTWAQFSG